ncbi:hypothetical protein HYU08_01915 [Candidatus Woesearchaeota archaeon]|nr:hypothetical protein [Candidatus Woesearchaeota archaeon]
MKIIVYFLLFAFAGVALEVTRNSSTSFRDRNPRLIGHSTLWMFPIYGSILFIVMLVQYFYADYSWWFRGFMYTGLILIWEYSSGRFIKKLVGIAPWNYAQETADGIGSPKRFHLHGLVCAEYIPLWFIGGLVAEALYLFLEAHVVF